MRTRLPAAIVGAIFGVFVIGPLCDRSLPYQRSNGRIKPTETAEIERGREVKVTYDTIIWRRCPGVVVRHVVDGDRRDHDYKPHEATIPLQARDDPVFSIKFVLPPATEESLRADWEYYADIKYQCNWTQWFWPLSERTPMIRFRPVK